MNDYMYMEDSNMYPAMHIHMKVDIITEGQHNGMILHQSVNAGPDGELQISTIPEFPQDWFKRGFPYANNAVGPAAINDPSRMISWNDQPLESEKDKRRKHRRKHRHDSEKRHRRRKEGGDGDGASDGGDSEAQREAIGTDLDSTPEFNYVEDGDMRAARGARIFPGSIPVFPNASRPVPAPRKYRDYEYEEELLTPQTFELPDRVRLNVFEEVEPARFSDADIKRIESNKRPIIQYPVDTEHETDAEQSTSNVNARNGTRQPERYERRQMYNVVPVETVSDTVTTTTTIEVFRTMHDPDNPSEHLILPPPPIPGAQHPQILRANGPPREIFTNTSTETLINDRPALRRIDQRAIQQPQSSNNSQSSTPQPVQMRRVSKETLIDDPGILLRPLINSSSTADQHYYVHLAMPPDDQQRAQFPSQRLTSSPTVLGAQSILAAKPKQTPEPAPRPAKQLSTTTPTQLQQRSDIRTVQSETMSSHSSLASFNRLPSQPSNRPPKMHLSMAPMTTTDFPSDLPDLPPQISPHHVIRVESLSPSPSPSERLPPPPLPVPIAKQQPFEYYLPEQPDVAEERKSAEPVDQMFSFDRTQVKVTNATNRPIFRPPPIPTDNQLRPFRAPPTESSDDESFQSEDAGTNNSFPPAPSPLDFAQNHQAAPSDKIYEIYTAKKSPVTSPQNYSFERPPTKASSSSHNSSLDDERNGASSSAAQGVHTEIQTTTTILKQREIYTIEETRTSTEMLNSSQENIDTRPSERRDTTSSFGNPDSRQSTLVKNAAIKQLSGGLSGSRSSIDSERSSVSGMMRTKGTVITRPDSGSDVDNLSDYLQGRMTPLGQDLNGLYYVDDSVKSQDSVISEASNRADRSNEYFERHRQEEHILLPPLPRSFAAEIRRSITPPPPPQREVRFNPVAIVRQSPSSSSTSLSSVGSAHPYQDETPRFAQVLSREPIRYDLQPAYGEARTESVSVLAERMRQMLEREEESLRLRSTVNTSI